jgi:hypothetical protein
MSSAAPAYRKLSSWQGLFAGASLLADEHCLISVRSSGYEEHVKRLYFNDIQAIVVSKSRRFAVSRRKILEVLLLLLVLFIASRYSPPLTTALWALSGVLIVTWLYISIRASCRCRVYTAVSQEELLSVRRPWSARKLLAELAPLIEASQGTLPAGWKESLATDRPILLNQASGKSKEEAAPVQHAVSHTGRLWASGFLVSSLLLDILQTSWDMQRTQPMPNWIGSALALLEAAAAVWVLIQNRGVNISLQRLGAAVLIFLGLAFYGQSGIAVVAQMQAQARQKVPLQAVEIRSTSAHRAYMEIYIGGCVVLAIMGAWLTLADPAPQRQRVPGD